MALTFVKVPIKPAHKTAFATTDVVPAPQTAPTVLHKVLVEPVVEQPTDIQTLTQEFIALYQKYEQYEVKELVSAMDKIKKQLSAYANETQDDTKPVVFKCAAGEIEFSERSKVCEITDPKALIEELVEKFGLEVAFSVVNIALTPLRKILSELELKKYSEEKPGHRTLKSVRPAK